MSRFRMTVSAVGAATVVLGMTTVGASTIAQASPKPAETVLAGSNAAFTSHDTATGSVSGSTRLSVQLWLKPDTAAASAFATAVSTPGNASYRHYLSPSAYTAKFAPTTAQVSQVESWLRSQGFSGLSTDAGRSYVRATGSVAAINAAFRTTLKTYQSSKTVNAGQYTLRANDSAVSLPSSIAGHVLGVTGLDNASPVSTLDKLTSATNPDVACSHYYGQHKTSGLPAKYGVTSFPTQVCGYTADELRAAYGANDTNVGSGQTVALVELGLAPKMFKTLQDYASKQGIAAPSTSRYSELSLGQGNACGDPFFEEEQLDVEAAYDMAPGANELVVGGDGCNEGDYGLQGLFDADTAVLNGNGSAPLATVASNSWEGGTESQPAVLTNIEHAYLIRSAAEGVGMYFSSGDGSGVESPSDDNYAIAVGGTTLGIGQAGDRLFETGWSTAVSAVSGGTWELLGEQGAAGGGPSLLYKQPTYQKGVVPNALAKVAGNRGGLVRSIPDISADADPYTGMSIGLIIDGKYLQTDIGGTSEAAPLVAGIVTAAQQGQSSSFGFINPGIYSLSGSSAFNDATPQGSSTPAEYRGVICRAHTCGLQVLTTFDEESPAMFGYTGQVTLPGYDNMSGLGTPNGQNFISALRGLSS